MPLHSSPSEKRDDSPLSGIRHDTAMAIEHLLGAGLYVGKAGTKATLRGTRAIARLVRHLF
ncbi:MAG: hypothetical protein PHE68_03655 [Candidatus Peribacteraceae bacterium]|nr:hypothetical protein [Candidatus Peribacteraceae bacterium]MDD5074841.1 hypothetical protein [Candidatus Peribacteraceae bacterium]